MNSVLVNGDVKRIAVTLVIGALLLTTLLAAIGAGPDEPKASNINDAWEIFEGHVYANNQAAPAGIAVVACLGGCNQGYATAPVITGWDGIYRVKVAPGQSSPEGRMVTFWLVNGNERIEAAQDVLFRGHGETRLLDISFERLPPEPSNTSASAQTAGVTAQLSVPPAAETGLSPSQSPQSYVNSLRYEGMPLLPGFVIMLGLLLSAIGVSLLVYRRRVAW